MPDFKMGAADRDRPEVKARPPNRRSRAIAAPPKPRANPPWGTMSLIFVNADGELTPIGVSGPLQALDFIEFR